MIDTRFVSEKARTKDEGNVRDEAEQNPSGFGFPAVVIFSLLILYLLAPGPLLKFLGRETFQSVFFQQMYRPVSFMCQRSSLVIGFYRWYISDLWNVPE